MSEIILVSNSAKKGKSSTLVELANVFLSKYLDVEILYSYKHKTSIDFTLIIKAKGSIVAFESQGSPNSQLENRLETIIPLGTITSARYDAANMGAIDQ